MMRSSSAASWSAVLPRGACFACHVSVVSSSRGVSLSSSRGGGPISSADVVAPHWATGSHGQFRDSSAFPKPVFNVPSILGDDRNPRFRRQGNGPVRAYAFANADVAVLKAAANASVKLFSVCAFVAWMQKSGRLPESTPSVLSQVAFKVLIPCFLFSKVAMTVAAEKSPKLLAIPLVAIIQVLLGASLGKAACLLVYGRPQSKPATLPRSTRLASASGGAGLGTALVKGGLEREISAEEDLTGRRNAVVTAACAFGNSFTLPLVFLTAVVGRGDIDRMISYIALFMVGWSPSLWTVGYNIVVGRDSNIESGGDVNKKKTALDSLFESLLRVVNPPLIGVFLGLLVGATPLSHLFIPATDTAAFHQTQTTFSLAPSLWHQTHALTAGLLHPLIEAAALLGSATLAVQSIVLAASLADSLPNESGLGGPSVAAKEPKSGSNNASISDVSSLLQDGSALAIITVVRLLLVPATTTLLLWAVRHRQWLPNDPICTLTLLTQAATPTAQNLILLFQLRPNTRPLAPAMAALLLRQYAIALLPLALWVTFFKSSLSAFAV